MLVLSASYCHSSFLMHIENGYSTALSLHVPSFSRDGLDSLVYNSKGERKWLSQHGSLSFPGPDALVTVGLGLRIPPKLYTHDPRAHFVTSE